MILETTHYKYLPGADDLNKKAKGKICPFSKAKDVPSTCDGTDCFAFTIQQRRSPQGWIAYCGATKKDI